MCQTTSLHSVRLSALVLKTPLGNAASGVSCFTYFALYCSVLNIGLIPAYVHVGHSGMACIGLHVSLLWSHGGHITRT